MWLEDVMNGAKKQTSGLWLQVIRGGPGFHYGWATVMLILHVKTLPKNMPDGSQTTPSLAHTRDSC